VQRITTNYVLSAPYIMPLLALGCKIPFKFYSQCKTEQEQSQFSFTVLFPLLLSIPLILIGMFFYPSISAFLSRENPIVKDYLWLIPFTGLCILFRNILCMG
jgi:Na+-driven multidrug efflux pump